MEADSFFDAKENSGKTTDCKSEQQPTARQNNHHLPEAFMGLDCREYLDAKQFEFLFNWYIRRIKSEGPSIKAEPLSYDGFSDYDQWFQRLSIEAQTAYSEHFGEPVPAIALTNLFHLAELEIAGK